MGVDLLRVARFLESQSNRLVTVKDAKGELVRHNQMFLDLYQLQGRKVLGLKESILAKHTDFYYEALHYCEETDEQTWESKRPFHGFECVPMVGGGVVCYEVDKIPVFNKDGSRKYIIVTGKPKIEIKKELA